MSSSSEWYSGRPRMGTAYGYQTPGEWYQSRIASGGLDPWQGRGPPWGNISAQQPPGQTTPPPRLTGPPALYQPPVLPQLQQGLQGPQVPQMPPFNPFAQAPPQIQEALPDPEALLPLGGPGAIQPLQGQLDYPNPFFSGGFGRHIPARPFLL